MRRRMSYLNVILTVNAVVLTGLLWTQVAEQPVFSATAVAQRRSGTPIRVPNAADQRKRMLAELQQIKRSVDLTRRSIETGSFKVEVTNLSELASVSIEDD